MSNVIEKITIYRLQNGREFTDENQARSEALKEFLKEYFVDEKNKTQVIDCIVENFSIFINQINDRGLLPKEFSRKVY